MDKKVMALAIASAFAAPAFAQAPTSHVTLYGRLNLGIDQYKATGSGNAANDLKSRTRIFDSGSRLGVRGTESLGSGLQAVFQIESGMNADTGNNLGQGGQTNASAGFLASRPSFVGLQGGFGRVTFGRQDVWWGNGTLSQTGANFINAEVPMFTGTQGRMGLGIARQSNVLQYTTPTFAGLNFTGSYSPQGEAQQGGLNTNGRILGLTGRGAWGPFGAQFDWAQLKGNTPAVGTQAKRDGIKILGGFTYMPGSQITLIGTQIKRNDTNFTGGGDIRQRMFGVGWEHTFGPVQVFAQYGRVGKASGCTTGASCDDTQSNAYMAGARYNLSKRTAVYAAYNAVRNKQNMDIDYQGGSMTSANPMANGADPRIIGLGVWHQF